jgi:uncharacterized membrane protein
MPLPIALTIAYLTVNLAMIVWLELERANGREPSWRVSAGAIALRFGPPLVGLIYLEMIAGDLLFLVFVGVFFVASFWLMDGLLAVTTPTKTSDSMRSGWDERSIRARSSTDREGS